MRIIFLFAILSLLNTMRSYAQLSPAVDFMHKTDVKSALITDYDYRDTIPSNSALVRLPNNKLALMVKENGKFEPFFIKAIETGYWDTRYEPDTNYDVVFADMRDMGANTAYVMLHWEDIEPRDGVFDYSFSDSVLEAAQRQGLKLKWILFLHAQRDKVPSLTPETAWTFHLDDRDDANYTMQWVKRNGELYKTIDDVLKFGIRPLHFYGHKEIFYRIRRMLYNLAVHYKNDETLIGVQIGNEEGFSFLDQSDYNPMTQALFEEWKLKTNKTDYAQFKKEAIDWWWQQFTSAYHEGDPYKILSFNLDGAEAEAGNQERIAQTGTSASTYVDGNLDAIGTMFYKRRGYDAMLGLDKCYGNSFNYQLPIFIPSEIGIGQFNSSVYFRHFVVHTLERAGQGFGVYCYGEVRKELVDKKAVREDLVSMFDAISANEDIIYDGLPGASDIIFSSQDTTIQVSHLSASQGATLAMIYQPLGKSIDEKELSESNITINYSINSRTNYLLTVYKNGIEIAQLTTQPSEIKEINLKNITAHDVLFISARNLKLAKNE